MLSKALSKKVAVALMIAASAVRAISATAAGGANRPGPGPRLGPSVGPPVDLPPTRNVGGGPAVASAARTTGVNIGGAGGYRHGSARGDWYAARAASYAGAYVAGAYVGCAYVGCAYGGERSSYYSSTDCYYAVRRYRRYLVSD